MLTARKGATIEVLSERKRSGLPQDIYAQAQPAPAYRALRRRHSRNGQAFLVADLFIDERLTKSIPRAAYTSKTALKLISDVPGIRIRTVKQTLTIGMADLETSNLLGLALNAPVAFVERAAIAEDGTLVLLTNGTYRGDVVRLDMQTNELPAKGRRT